MKTAIRIFSFFAIPLALALIVGGLPACGGDDDSDELKPDAGYPAARGEGERVKIYQLVVRLFSNINTTNKQNGSIVENGCGQFEDINDTAIESLADMGITHIWLTGVLQQATATDYSDIGEPADDPDILKGKAGSFYAVKDYYDTSPDYAVNPSNRLEEFQSLVKRIHDAGLKTIIDFVPNHVARSYHSTIKPDSDFGLNDDKTLFFSAQNNFFYLVDPPGQSIALPAADSCPIPGACDGKFEAETVPRATGNNVTSPAPSINDWYETVKLNYGFNFIENKGFYDPTPNTWNKMNDIIAYWQSMGVDGFRTDFSHYVPIEAWRHLITKARERNDEVFFVAEAYNAPDAAPGFSFQALIEAGFDAVYDDGLYDAVKRIYCCGAWANDLNDLMPNDYLTDKMLRYAENHDEKRVASPVINGENPDDSGFGDMNIGKPVAAFLFTLSGGPVLVYNGQEVGEPAAGAEGFSGDDGKSSIFDYWAMPELAKWVNGYAYDGGALSEPQKSLRNYYSRLLKLLEQPAIADGYYYGIQHLNKNKTTFGNSGQWLFAFLRYTADYKQRLLIIVNFSPTEAFTTSVMISNEALEFMNFTDKSKKLSFKDIFESDFSAEQTVEKIPLEGLNISISPLSTLVLEIK